MAKVVTIRLSDVDSVEMAQILADKRLIGKLETGLRDAKKRRGRFVA